MTPDRTRNERISAWLLEEAPDKLPDWVLEATFERLRTERRRRLFAGWRSFPMTRLSPAAIAVGAAAILVVAIGAVLLRGPDPSVGVLPSATPVTSPTATPAATPAAEPSSGASPTLAPVSLTGQIAFQRTVDGNPDIYLMNLDRTGLVRLTDDPGPDWQPAWTPDGRTLFFARQSLVSPEQQQDIYTLDVATGTEVQLTDAAGVEGGVQVSPDGKSIVFDQWPINPGTYVMGVDGSNPRRIFRAPDDTYVLVGWTADGTGVYLIRSGIEVIRVDVATGNVQTVATGGNESLRLSPDGTTFAYQDASPPGGVSLMDVDGSNIRHLAGSWTDKGGPMTWAPDGAHLAFSRPDHWYYLMATDGSGLTRWTEGGPSLAWRPEP